MRRVIFASLKETSRNRVGDFPFLQSAGNPIVRVRPEANAIVVPILERLLLEYHLHQPDKLDLCRLYLLTLFTELKRFVAPPEATSVHAAIRLTEQYKNKLARHIYEKQKVSEYADLLTVTPNHLNKCAKVATGKTAQTLLNEMLLLEAKVLLKETDLNINEIACKISGQDPSNFGRFFKTKTGVTPVAYRQQM
jgi:AraC-like DNA-binding protein